MRINWLFFALKIRAPYICGPWLQSTAVNHWSHVKTVISLYDACIMFVLLQLTPNNRIIDMQLNNFFQLISILLGKPYYRIDYINIYRLLGRPER